jgi:hypothetical protein
MSFQSEMFPYRNNRIEFPRRLLNKVDREFTKVESVPGYPRESLSGRRCGWGICNFTTQPSDKAVVKTLLKAWMRDISDRYLNLSDFRVLRKLTRFKSVDESYEILKQNSPPGAVRFIYNDIPASAAPLVLFGNSLPKNLTYNQYFSRLLAWDYTHCFGLVAEIATLENKLSLGGGSGTNYMTQAAKRWIAWNQRNNPKSVYYVLAHS